MSKTTGAIRCLGGATSDPASRSAVGTDRWAATLQGRYMRWLVLWSSTTTGLNTPTRSGDDARPRVTEGCEHAGTAAGCGGDGNQGAAGRRCVRGKAGRDGGGGNAKRGVGWSNPEDGAQSRPSGRCLCRCSLAAVRSAGCRVSVVNPKPFHRGKRPLRFFFFFFCFASVGWLVACGSSLWFP